MIKATGLVTALRDYTIYRQKKGTGIALIYEHAE